MTAAATNSSTFPLFQCLAPELRFQIWRDALSDIRGRALYFYKKGCWRPRRLSKSDERYNHEREENNLSFEFRHDLLDDVQFDVPLLFANREARGIALAWVRKLGIQVRPRENRPYPVFARPFDPARDAIYITLDKWIDFLSEAPDRLFQPDLIERLVNVVPGIWHIAVPEALLRSEVASLPDLFLYYHHIEVIYIITNEEPDLQPADDSSKVQHRWEFEDTQRGAFFWNYDRDAFDPEDRDHIEDEALHGLIEEAGKVLAGELAVNDVRNFEIRPILAVRK